MTSALFKKRGYAVPNASQARRIADEYLTREGVQRCGLGLPEFDDRYRIWRVPLTTNKNEEYLGHIAICARTSLVQSERTTATAIVKSRQQTSTRAPAGKNPPNARTLPIPALRNTVLLGDSEFTLRELPAESVDLVFTSPPYFNARPGYAEYAAYDDYLFKIEQVVKQCHRLLAEGRFLVINAAPVLLRRTSRSRASKRIALPFDLHHVITKTGFDFIDDIIWQKPSGAGWATNRGRRFAADRNPLQYKTVPVTEYVLVYRKQTERLIDWNIRNHPDQAAVTESKIGADYEPTNIWRISPTSSKHHPAVFPRELADRVIRYYSFKRDVVLDPFAGIGTVGESCIALNRKFVLAEIRPEYADTIKHRIVELTGTEAENVQCIGTPPIKVKDRLL